MVQNRRQSSSFPPLIHCRVRTQFHSDSSLIPPNSVTTNTSERVQRHWSSPKKNKDPRVTHTSLATVLSIGGPNTGVDKHVEVADEVTGSRRINKELRIYQRWETIAHQQETSTLHHEYGRQNPGNRLTVGQPGADHGWIQLRRRMYHKFVYCQSDRTINPSWHE